MCGEATATASTRPPRVSSTTSPLTIACDEARNASRSVINGSWKKPSYTSSTHLRATSRLKRFCCLLSTARSEEHTSELQSLMRTSYAVFCLQKKNNIQDTHSTLMS